MTRTARGRTGRGSGRKTPRNPEPAGAANRGLTALPISFAKLYFVARLLLDFPASNLRKRISRISSSGARAALFMFPAWSNEAWKQEQQSGPESSL